MGDTQEIMQYIQIVEQLTPEEQAHMSTQMDAIAADPSHTRHIVYGDTFGKLAMGVETGLDAAIKGSDMGLRAIDIGERASKVKSVGDARSVYGDARNLARQVRP